MTSKSLIACAAVVSAVVLSSCSDPQFRISGEIADGGGKSVVLEKADFHGRWMPVDSVKVGGNGNFKISAPAPASPEIYRLALDGRYVYFPVDSIESLTLSTSLAGFGTDYELDGSDGARAAAAFDRDLQSLTATDSASVAGFKRAVYTKYIKEGRGSIVSYYVLTKFRDGKPLYDPADPADARYYAAVATQFDHYRPGDPHGRMVRDVSLDAMRRRHKAEGRQTVYQAGEVGLIDIALPDETGKVRKLSEVAGKGRPVLLVFSMMNQRESPAFNRKLAEVRSRGYEIFHVCFDQGQYEWREAAANLPWVTVLDPNGTSSTSLVDYNVQVLPAMFLYNAAGELTSRPADFDELK